MWLATGHSNPFFSLKNLMLNMLPHCKETLGVGNSLVHGHCVGAVGRGNLERHYHTVRGQWALQILKYTTTLQGAEAVQHNPSIDYPHAP